MKCKLEKIEVYYEIYGEGFPLLMIHGFEVDHRVMKGCMEPIFEHRIGYQRIYFDLPGMGETPGKSWIRSSDDMLKVVLDFIDEVIPNQEFIIASESYGCYLARGVIQKKFNFIKGIIFICPVIFAETNRRELPEHITLIKDPQLLESLKPSDRREFKNLAVIQNQIIWERFRDEFYSGVKNSDGEFLNRIWERMYPFSFDVDAHIPKFDKPTLFLMGRQDSIVGYRDAWKVIEKYPRASFCILDQSGHLLQIEKEKIFNSLVNEWLNRVEQIIS